MRKQLTATPDCFQFLAGDLTTSDKPQADGSELKTFSGVAYHGGLIADHWYWGNLVFDLDKVKFAKETIPSLLEHDPSQRCGIVTGFNVDDKGLRVSGNLLSNDNGTEVYNDAKEGYPWQMSVSIAPATIEEVEQGTVVVNGQTFNAPITIFRGNTINEVSFCVFGADSQTSATVFKKQSAPADNPSNPTEDNVNELEELKTKVAELTQLSADKDAQLQQFKDAKRDEDITALAAKTGKEFTADELNRFKAMDEDNFKFMASMLPAKVESNPATNLISGEIANNGKSQTQFSNDLDGKFEAFSQKTLNQPLQFNAQ